MKKTSDQKLIHPIPDEQYKSSIPETMLKEADGKRATLIGEYIKLAYPDKRPLSLRTWRDEHQRRMYLMVCRYEECGEEFEATRKDTLFCKGNRKNCRLRRHQDKAALKEALNEHWYWVYHQCEVRKALKPRMVAAFLSTRQSF